MTIKIKKSARLALTRWLASHRDLGVTRAGAHAARVFLEMYENYNYEHATNGEAWLLHRLAAVSPTCVFDVGANVGGWTAEVRTAMPRTTVHAFELVPSTAERLTVRFAGDSKVRVNQLGLLDEPGSVQVKHYPDFPEVSSVNDFPHPLGHEWLQALATTGDLYCRENGVEHIDFLKIDAEGAEHRVMRGFRELLSSRRVDVMQFEYGRAAIRNRFLLRDFYTMVEDFGMTVGKLYPNHVAFREYDVNRHEDFLGPNFVAVLRDREDLIEMLSK